MHRFVLEASVIVGVHGPVALRFAAVRNELQRDAVVAPAFPSRRRAVVKDMAIVAGATRNDIPYAAKPV